MQRRAVAESKTPPIINDLEHHYSHVHKSRGTEKILIVPDITPTLLREML